MPGEMKVTQIGQKLPFTMLSRAHPLEIEQQTPMCRLGLRNPILPVHNRYAYRTRPGELPNRTLERIRKAISQSDAN